MPPPGPLPAKPGRRRTSPCPPRPGGTARTQLPVPPRARRSWVLQPSAPFLVLGGSQPQPRHARIVPAHDIVERGVGRGCGGILTEKIVDVGVDLDLRTGKALQPRIQTEIEVGIAADIIVDDVDRC